MGDEGVWRKWCEQAAAARGISYEEVVAELAAGRAVLEISATIFPDRKIEEMKKP